MRVVKDLVWAKPLDSKPLFIRRGRHRGAKAKGIRYENLIAEACPWAKQGQWWEFFDAQGLAWCQTDLLWRTGDFVVVGEVKYSWVPEAQEKLLRLYLPVVEKALGVPTRGIILCRRLVPGVKATFGDLRHAQSFALATKTVSPIATFQWLGGTHISDPRIEPLKRRMTNEQRANA